MAMTVPPSVLFKQRSEGRIKAEIVRDDLIECFILLLKKAYEHHAIN